MTVEIETQAPVPAVAETPPESPVVETPVAEAPTEEAAKPVKKSLRELVDGDEDYRKEFQTEVNREKQRELAKVKREREKELVTKASEDPLLALELAQSKKTEFDSEDSEIATYRKRVEDAKDIFDYHAQNPEWAATNNAFVEANRADCNKRHAADPIGYMKWVNEQVIERMVEARAEKKAEVRARAIAEEIAKGRMQGVPRVPEGGPASQGPSYGSEQDVRNALAEDRISAREARVLIARFERR